MIVEGENAIAEIRGLAGPTIKKNKETGELILPPVGTIRRDIPTALGQELDMTKNVIHSSDGAAAAELEGSIFAELKKEYIKNDDRTK